MSASKIGGSCDNDQDKMFNVTLCCDVNTFSVIFQISISDAYPDYLNTDTTPPPLKTGLIFNIPQGEQGEPDRKSP